MTTQTKTDNWAIQRKGREPEYCTNEKQDVDVHILCNINNTAKLDVDAYPMDMGNNNNSNKIFFSELIKEDDMKTNVKQTNQRNNNNNYSEI